jgi:hypothetical protein
MKFVSGTEHVYAMAGLPDDDSSSQPGLKDTTMNVGLTLMPLTMCTTLLQNGSDTTHKR